MRTATLIENFELLAFGMVQTVAWEESGKQRVRPQLVGIPRTGSRKNTSFSYVFLFEKPVKKLVTSISAVKLKAKPFVFSSF